MLAQASSWYAIRVTYSREMLFKEYCDENNITNFLPLEYRIQERGGIKTRKLLPVVHNLIFLKATRSSIDEIKGRFPIRYIMDRMTNRPIVVPEVSMQHFIAVAGNYEEQIVFLDPCEIASKVGSRVRITEGVFKGVEGVLMKVRNNKRVVVQLSGLMVVATHYVHPSLIEIIE